jgi:redox-sensing transcriptional repressor
MSEAQATCSSDQLAAAAGVTPSQVRKDLSYLGSYGVRGVGYSIADLQEQLRTALGLHKGYSVVILGVGNLGSALATYPGFVPWGFEVVALFDVDRAKIGTSVGGHDILALEDLEQTLADEPVDIGIVATPAGAAQDVADRLVAAGVRSILNFAPTVLHVPDSVKTRRLDVSTQLQILTYHLQSAEEPVPAASQEQRLTTSE